MEKLQGKIAVVTGASAGIGEAIAVKFVQEGINVVGFARRKERVEKLAKDLIGKNGAKLHALKVDITNETEIVEAFEFIAKNLGNVSILVNNAGIAPYSSLIDGDATKWKEVIDTNILGLCVATREAVNVMRKNNIEGHIIHINCIEGHKVINFPGANVYSASKFAVTALAQTLVNELRSSGCKIKVTSLSPGFVETEIMQVGGYHEDDNKVEAIVKDAPRLFPKDVANAVAYVLATPPHVQVTELTIQALGEDL